MNNDKNSASISLCFADLLTVAFIVLKLCGVIDWSWWAVLAPIWVGLAIVIIAVAAVIIYEAIIRHRKRRWRTR